MIIFTEKRAEEFLTKMGFKVADGIYVKKERNLREAIIKIGFPLVMKVSGEKIVHKKQVHGVKTNMNSYDDVLRNFNELKKINGMKEVILQKQVLGKEFLLGIKKTPEFGHVLVFGQGGTDVEKRKNFSFRVCPIGIKDAVQMVRETEYARGLNEESKKKIEHLLIGLCHLVQTFPEISELDINPLIVNSDDARIVDARIVFN